MVLLCNMLNGVFQASKGPGYAASGVSRREVKDVGPGWDLSPKKLCRKRTLRNAHPSEENIHALPIISIFFKKMQG